MDLETLAKLVGEENRAVKHIVLASQRNPEYRGTAFALLAQMARKNGIDLNNPPKFEKPKEEDLEGIFTIGEVIDE